MILKISGTLGGSEHLGSHHRPQTPVPPFPYASEDVTFRNEAEDFALAGTLTLPPADGPHPAVVLISGSGPQDRDETILDHKPFLVIADTLTRRGIAVLRVDDRGVGRSGGSRTGATSDVYANDALAAVTFLAGRADIDAQRIGLVGHSEGGIIAPIAAARSTAIAFIVMLAGPGIPGFELAVLQTRAMQTAAGASRAIVEFNVKLQQRVIAILMSNTDETIIRREVDVVLKDALAGVGLDDEKTLSRTRAAMEDEIKKALDPWQRFFMQYDPRLALTTLRIPILAMNGDKDVQVPAAENLAAIERAFRDAGNANGRTLVMPGLNHLFQTADTGSITEYAEIEETLAPAALTAMGDWLVAEVNRRAA